MSCYCDYDYAPDFYKQVWKKANKTHKCCECGHIIQPKEVYEHVSGKWDGHVGTYKTCERCVDLRDSLGDCCVHTGLFEDYGNTLYGQTRNSDEAGEQVQKVRTKHREWVE